MKIDRPTLVRIAIAFFVATSIAFSSQRVPLRRLELGMLDVFFHLRKSPAFNPNIIIIEIDDENIAKIGRWPWDREWHGAIVHALKELGAKYTCFDIVFSESSSGKNDKLFSQSIKRAGNVYLPLVFQEKKVIMEDAVKPLKIFSDHANDSGSINIYPDIDGILRKIPLFFEEDDKTYYHLALKVAMDYLDVRVEDITPRYLVLSNVYRKIHIPLLEGNKVLINWTGKWKNTFKHYSFLNVLSAYKAVKDNGHPDIDVAAFKDSICMVGATAVGLYDIKPVPLEPEYPAIGILATAISNILDSRFIGTVPRWATWLFIYFLALLPALSVSGDKPLREIVFVLLYAPLFITASFFVFKLGLWIDCSIPLLAFFGSYSGVTVYNFFRTSIEKQHFFTMAITDELTKLYNIRYFTGILKNECSAPSHEFDKKFSVVMVDIDDFKHVNDVFGHRVGNVVLKEVADIVKKSVRSSDVVARFGGEEMIILLKGAPLDEGVQFAEKVRKNIEDRVIRDGDRTYTLTVSLGVASYNGKDNEESMMKRADEGLYRAKRAGKNRVATVESSRSDAF